MNMSNSEFQESIYCNDAGLVILSPFLNTLFEKCGLTHQNRFIDDLSKSKAVHLLLYAETGRTGPAILQEQFLALKKVLCGMAVTDTIEINIKLADEETKTVDSMLEAVIQHWTALGQISIEGLRESFLNREGQLDETDAQYNLRVQRQAYDILMDRLPWSIHMIRLSWMRKTLLVEW